MARLLLILSCFLIPVSSSSAALDPNMETPYQLQVVLHMSKHRLLTRVFHQQVQRELEDGLQAAFGAMAKVKVVDQHPRLKEVVSQGLEALTTWNHLEDHKSHFVMIQYRNGRYIIRARQHDGLTGQPSPVVREASTTDRPFVARLATLLIDRDFGLVGTILPGSNPKDLNIKIYGGKLRNDLDRWVKKGEVFLLVPIRVGQNTAVPESDTLLRIESAPKEGEVQARLFYRRGKPLEPRAHIKGFRCLKLGTRRGPVRLRMVQYRTKLPADNLRLRIRRYGFEREESTLLERVTDPDGLYSSKPEGDKGLFDHMVFVEAMTRPNAAWIPVPLIDDKPVSLAVSVQPQDERSRLEARKELWVRDVQDTDQMLTSLFEELRKMSSDPKRVADLVTQAKTGLSVSEKAARQLKEERSELKKAEAVEGITLKFTRGDRFLKNLEDGHEKLKAFIQAQEEILEKKNDPKLQKWLAAVNRAKLEEKNGNIDMALELYNQVLDEGFKNQSVVDRRDQLAQMWKIKSEGHKQARTFVYNIWPNLDPLAIQGQLPTIEKHLKELEIAKDAITAKKFNEVAEKHVAKLLEASKALRVDIRLEDEEKAKRIDAISKAMEKLILQTDKITQ